MRKNGGIYFWTVGNYGGTFYRKRVTFTHKVERHYAKEDLVRLGMKLGIVFNLTVAALAFTV